MPEIYKPLKKEKRQLLVNWASAATRLMSQKDFKKGEYLAFMFATEAITPIVYEMKQSAKEARIRSGDRNILRSTMRAARKSVRAQMGSVAGAGRKSQANREATLALEAVLVGASSKAKELRPIVRRLVGNLKYCALQEGISCPSRVSPVSVNVKTAQLADLRR